MSTSKLSAVLEKLDKAMGKKRESNPNGKIDFKELGELKKKSFTKLKEGKNNIAVVPSDQEDPFVIWAYHNSLQEVDYYSVPCDAYNKGTECVVCNIIDDLKSDNEQGNKHLWYPIRQQFEFYTEIVNLESDATISEGPKWLRFGKSIMGQFKEWLNNTDEDEQPFYSDEEPQKVIITYTKGVAPADMYKLDKKNMKPFAKSVQQEWKGKLKPVADFMFSKSQADLKKIVDSYFERIGNEVAVTPSESTPSDSSEKVDVVESAPKKLEFLKKK